MMRRHAVFFSLQISAPAAWWVIEDVLETSLLVVLAF